MPPLSRRQFVATAATATLPAFLRAEEPKAKDEPVAFFLVGDTPSSPTRRTRPNWTRGRSPSPAGSSMC